MEIRFVQILFQIINFGVVAGALTYLLYKPIMKTLQKRSEKIAEGQKAADEVIREKEQIEELKKTITTDAKKVANTVVAEAKESAESKKRELLAQAKVEVKEFIADEKEKWEKEKAQLARSMEKEFTDSVFAVVEKVLGNGLIDPKAHTSLINDSIKEITKAL